ncbi:uncharacterized protein BX664DRAFT_342329 [Halteromyces radiatus]|uniref:uncharacterized protein n=1 Tax=Halteromyces radiatus TaxID=101107 RepID=UPI0022204D98|nr:uncharacterized protein BX664DRAFT_342329 [Halteromyces radiatus]KAI8078628.1 hypothetical protein BX664DRAFT_342329 [Halteromyces radiatus]
MITTPLPSRRSVDLVNRSKVSITYKSTLVTNSPCISRPSSTIEGKQKTKNSNFQYVLQLLDFTYRGFLTNSQAERPDEPLGALVNRTLQYDTLLDFIDISQEPAIIAQPTSSSSVQQTSISTTPSTYIPSNATSTTTLTPLSSSNPLDSSFITYNQMHTFISSQFNLAQFNLQQGSRVAICLPQGPALGLCMIATMAYCACAPSNDSLTPEELLHDFKNMRVQAVIISNTKLQAKDDPMVTTLRQGGLQLIGLETEPDNDILFTLHGDPQFHINNDNSTPTTTCDDDDDDDDNISSASLLNQADDIVLVLQTSGTSGTKKVVPYSLRTICVATTCVSASYGAQPTDVNINMMPLYHVGGVVRSLLTPLFTSGSVILCNGFDAALFWDILEKQSRHVWYFAVPTMHQAILQEATMRRFSQQHSLGVRMVCNAGGDLLPALANRIKAQFTNAVVLPSYGMTECLPISAPPRDYDLSRSGTSGLLVGPNLMIAKDGYQVHQDGVTGHIMVQGIPCFSGYEGVDNSSTFDADGWFDTGDMGYLENGYLYITGRSKEIINRGGEVISPFEIEQVLMTHPRVAQAMVFSVPHDTLQETIGAVIVTREGSNRPDLRTLRSFMNQKLHQSKLPQVLVYMDDVPKSNVNKILRIQFSNRLDIPMFMDSENNINVSQRLYEAVCPPKGTPLTEPIVKSNVTWSTDDVITTIMKHPQVDDCAAYNNSISGQTHIFVVKNDNNNNNNDNVEMDFTSMLQQWLSSQVHDYMLPRHIHLIDQLVRNDDGTIDGDYLHNLAQQQQETSDDPVALLLRDIFAYVLGLSSAPSSIKDDRQSIRSTSTVTTVANATFPVDGDFFEYGGNSLKSGFLISQIRAKLGVVLPVTILYEGNNRTPIGLAETCGEKIAKDHPLLTMGYNAYKEQNSDQEGQMENNGNQQPFGSPDYKKRMAQREPSGARNPFNPIIMLIQASGVYFMQPIQTTSRWFFFAYMLSCIATTWTNPTQNHGIRLVQLLLALGITAVASAIVFPLVAVIIKWIVIGKYRTGSYPLWGQYYLRWWIVNRVIDLAGLGIFGAEPWLHCLYLRMMGAKVGKSCHVNPKADVREFDLVTIGDGCTLDEKCSARPFTLSTGHMNLNPLVIGDNCVVGLRSFVIAGTTLAPGTVMGPSTANFPRNLQAGDGALASIDTPQGMALADACAAHYPPPHFLLKLLVGWPLVFIINLIANAPWIGIIYLLTNQSYFVSGQAALSSRFSQLILYFAQPKRVGLHLLAVAVRKSVVPLFYLILVILCKRTVIGKFKAGPRRRDQLSLFRYWLMKTLLPPGENLQGVASIIGTHYEPISIIYRLLGAKVGKRIYWPGSGLHVVEYDLLTIGDDVVFGSRSFIQCSDTTESIGISIGDGAMIADNCVLLPGSQVGRRAVLGSGGLLKKNFRIEDGSTWFGSFNGNAVKFKDGTDTVNIKTKSDKNEKFDDNKTINNDEQQSSTITPFGRAFYQRKANYFVVPLFLVVPFNIFVKMAASVLWAAPITAAIQVAAYYQRGQIQLLSLAPVHHVNNNTQIFSSREGWAFLIIFGVAAGIMTTLTFLCLALDIGWKWTLFGRRKQGQYNWDESSYCQRWQFLITVQQALRQNALNLIGGSGWIMLYFRGMGCRIGKRVCLYPSGGDPMMTEPDLVTLEDDVAVDKASLVCHMNTLGQFSINPLHVGAGSVLRSGSRLATGATMMEDCTILENSLIISGEVADRGSIWQGYPAVDITQLSDDVDEKMKF